MNFKEILKNTFNSNMNAVLIFSTVVGTVLSACAQICAIKENNEYTDVQKDYMKKQEVADARANILTYLGFTLPIVGLASKAVSTGKIAPKSVLEYLDKKRWLDIAEKGKWSDDIDKILKDKQDEILEDIEKGEEYLSNNFMGTDGKIKNPINVYNSFKDAVKSYAAIGAAIISSNIIAPIIRNRAASRRHNKELEKNKVFNPISDNVVLNKPEPVTDRSESKPSVISVSRTFDDFRSHVHGMRI